MPKTALEIAQEKALLGAPTQIGAGGAIQKLGQPLDIKTDTTPKADFSKEPVLFGEQATVTSPKLQEDLQKTTPIIAQPEIQPQVEIKPSELQETLQAQVGVTKAAQEDLERQKQDILSRFEGDITVRELEGLNKFEIQDKIKEFELKEKERTEVTRTFEEEISFQQRSQDRRLSIFDQNVQDMKTDFDNRINDSKEQARINDENANKISALTGTSFSSAGLAGLESIHSRGVKLIDRLEAARDSAITQVGIQREQALDDFSRSMNSLTKEQDNALNRAKTEFLAAAFEIDADLDITTQQGLDNLIKIKDDFLDRQRQIQDDTQNQMQFELDSTEQIFNILDTQDERQRNIAIQDFDRFADLDNLQNVNSSDIIQFSKRFPEKAQEIASTLVNRQINNTALGIDKALEQFGVKGFSFSPDIKARIEKGIREEGKTPNAIMSEIVGELLQDTEKLESLRETGLTEEQRVERREVSIKEAKEGIQTRGFIASTGTGQITQNYGDTSRLGIDNVLLADGTTGTPGLDIDGVIGDPIMSPINGEVVDIIQSNTGLGNRVLIKDNQGNIHYFNHLFGADVSKGDTIIAGKQIGTMGNSGSVIAGPGGDGSHLDYRVKSGDGQWIDPNIFNNLTTKDAGDIELAESIVNGTGDIKSLTATENKTMLPIVNELIESKLTDDKDRNLIIRSSLETKELSESAVEKFQDMDIVRFQLDRIEETLAGQDTGPITGILTGKNPYNVEAQVALAQLAGLTPKVARGIFGEVGVLTDTDIKNYQRALPNLTSTKEKNDLIVKFMRDLLSEGYKRSIVTQAKANRNVSKFLPDYDSLQEKGPDISGDRISQIKDRFKQNSTVTAESDDDTLLNSLNR